MLCAILVASSAAGLPALRDLSVRERASGELKRPAGGPQNQKGLSAVAPHIEQIWLKTAVFELHDHVSAIRMW